MVEGVRGVVGKRKDSGIVVFIAEAFGDQLKVVLQAEILRLFVDHLLEAFYASHCHLDANHHV